MKIALYISAFLMVGLTSCDKNDEVAPRYVSAKINSADWSGSPEINLNDQNDTLTFLGVGNENVFGFKLQFRGEGVYDLSDLKSFYYTTIGGDAFTSSYKLDTGKSATVTISGYDSQTNSLRGSFEISLVKEWSNPENNIDSISFSEGEFSGTIVRQ